MSFLLFRSHLFHPRISISHFCWKLTTATHWTWHIWIHYFICFLWGGHRRACIRRWPNRFLRNFSRWTHVEIVIFKSVRHITTNSTLLFCRFQYRRRRLRFCDNIFAYFNMPSCGFIVESSQAIWTLFKITIIIVRRRWGRRRHVSDASSSRFSCL